MEMHFCRRCGQPLTRKKDHIYRCPSNHTLFEWPDQIKVVDILHQQGIV